MLRRPHYSSLTRTKLDKWIKRGPPTLLLHWEKVKPAFPEWQDKVWYNEPLKLSVLVHHGMTAPDTSGPRNFIVALLVGSAGFQYMWSDHTSTIMETGAATLATATKVAQKTMKNPFLAMAVRAEERGRSRDEILAWLKECG